MLNHHNIHKKYFRKNRKIICEYCKKDLSKKIYKNRSYELRRLLSICAYCWNSNYKRQSFQEAWEIVKQEAKTLKAIYF